MPEMTERERQVWELRHGSDTPMTFVAIAEKLGISYSVARNYYQRASAKKLAMPDPFGSAPHHSVEHKDPEKAAHFIDLMTDPLSQNIAEAARESGVHPSAAQRLAHRVQTRYQPLQRELERVKTDVLVRELEHLAKDALGSITQEDIEKLDAYKRTLVAAIAIDKRELLDGRPTERISVEDRRSLDEVVTVLMQEAERRGYTKQVNPDTGATGLTDREDATLAARMGKERMPLIESGD